VAVASALPYLALKVIWLGGGALGVADSRMMRESSMLVLNALTAGMDVVGIVLALAFAHGWGVRIPAWLVLPPMWVATGLLARFVLAVPIAGMLFALAPDSWPSMTAGPVHGWVYALVYAEFAGLGTGLMVAFFFYTRMRWPELFQSVPLVLPTGLTHDVLRLLANATAPAAMALSAIHLAWAFGATAGLSEAAATSRTAIGSVINGIDAVLIMAAAIGVLMMVYRIGKRPSTNLSLAIAWTGTASLFSWGLWQTINVVGQTALMRGAEGRGFVNLVGLARLVVGLTMGLLFLLLVSEKRQSARRHLVDAAG
jgi:hypothetical protein